MARRKPAVYQALSRAHLEGIGRVAATWNRLEQTIMFAIYEVGGVDTAKFSAVLATTGFGTYLLVLKRFVAMSKEHKSNKTAFNQLCEWISVLYGRRNEIVHTHWRDKSGLALFLDPSLANSKIARGLSYEKRKLGWVTDVAITAAEMRLVARDMDSVQAALANLIASPPKERQRLVRAIAREHTRRHENQRLRKPNQPFRPKLTSRKPRLRGLLNLAPPHKR